MKRVKRVKRVKNVTQVRKLQWVSLAAVAAVASMSLVGADVAHAAAPTQAAAQINRVATPQAPGQAVAWSSSQWNTFVADVSVKVRRVKANGEPAGIEAPPVKYRWERAQSGAGWKTTMTFERRTMVVGRGAGRQEVEIPFAVARVEDDEDGSPLRMFGADGRRIVPPSMERIEQAMQAAVPGLKPPPFPVAPRPGVPSPRPFVGSAERDWVGAFVATPQLTSNRRTRLTQQFVKRGQVRGLDRYTKPDGDVTREVLTDPATVVPMEVNLLRGNAMVSHSTIAYATTADGSLVRRLLHAEQELSPVSGERTIVDTEYSNVRVERR